MPNLYRDQILGTLPNLQMRTEIHKNEIEKYLRYINREHSVTEEQYNESQWSLFQKGLKEQSYFFLVLYETVHRYMRALDDESSEEYLETLEKVNIIYEKWKWELHFFYKYEFLPAKDSLQGLILRGIYNPVGFNSKSKMGLSASVDKQIEERVVKYLVVLITEAIIIEFKQENFERYDELGYEKDGRSIHLSSSDEKEIVEDIVWEVKNYYDHEQNNSS